MSDIAIKWQQKRVNTNDLKLYDRNPRRISKESFEKLKRSIQEDGYHQRIVANADLSVIGGHQRIKALKELGIKEVDVLVPQTQLDEETFRRILIRDNLQAGEWDFDALANDFEVDELLDWGFPEELLPKQEGVVNEPAGDEDDAPAAPTTAQTIRGDLYEIGPHRLLCGDSTLIDSVDALLDGVKADVVFTDPPYGIDLIKGKSGKVGGGTKKHPTKVFSAIIGDSEEYDPSFLLIYAPVCIIWGGNYYANKLPNGRCWFIWHKNHPVDRTFCGCELAWTNLDKHSKVYSVTWDGWTKEGQSGAKVHPSEKPVKLAFDILTDVEGAKILDLFAGSGSTMVAAHKLGRTAYLMELDEKYCDVIVQRMHKLFPELPIKRNGTPFTVIDTVNG